MSIQYSGSTLINNAYTSDGTLAGMQSWLISELEAAGWIVSSGSGSDITLVSATTPQGLNIYFRFYNPTTGNCIQITMKSLIPSLTSSIGYLLPTSGVTYRIVANKYQFFIFASGSVYCSTARYIAIGGVPWVPAGVVISIGSLTTAGWFQYSGTSDTDTDTDSLTFRNQIGGQGYSDSSTIWRGVVKNYTNDTDNHPRCEIRADTTNLDSICRLWADGSFKVFEAFIGWEDSSLRVAAIVGQIWDAIVVGAGFTSESTFTFDRHTYMSITGKGWNNWSLLVAVA
jgi:hypothetical protein